jgi:serine/threonine protein kinase
MRDTGSWAVTVPPGYRIDEWEITRGIATGSWSSVYEARRVGRDDGDGARDDSLPGTVAVKILPTGTMTTRQLNHMREMADRELRFHRAGEHRRLIRAIGTHQIDDPDHPELDGSVVLVMEKAERSLADLMHEHAGKPVPDAESIIEQICEGLAHMHGQGWVHGDLKPGNVLLMSDGSVRLADFGLAAELEGTHAYLPPMGTSDYVPPERWTESLGERGMAIRATADVWALGVTAFELLSGRPPFPGEGPRARAITAAEQAKRSEPLLIPANVPEAWHPILRDCLAPNHTARKIHDTTSLLRRIKAARTGRPARPGTISQSRRFRRWRAIAAILLIAAAVLVVAVRANPQGRPEKASPAPAQFRPDLIRTDKGIPPQYRELIVVAAGKCKTDGLTPALVAALLKVESDFNPDLSDPAKDEYGIARWTPKVLAWFTNDVPPKVDPPIPAPPFPPDMSIPAVGRMMCQQRARMGEFPGVDPGLLLAAGYLSSIDKIKKANGIPASIRPTIDQIDHWRSEYQP